MTWKFVSFSDEAVSAADADTLTTLDFGNALYKETKKVKFRLGNTGGNVASFTVQVSGVNSTLIADTTLSLDDTSYSSSVFVSGVDAGQISPVVFAKHVVRADAVAASGIVRMHVVEE